MLAMDQREYGLGNLNEMLAHMLLCNSKELIQNHVGWSYIIKIFKYLNSVYKLVMGWNLGIYTCPPARPPARLKFGLLG